MRPSCAFSHKPVMVKENATPECCCPASTLASIRGLVGASVGERVGSNEDGDEVGTCVSPTNVGADEVGADDGTCVSAVGADDGTCVSAVGADACTCDDGACVSADAVLPTVTDSTTMLPVAATSMPATAVTAVAIVLANASADKTATLSVNAWTVKEAGGVMLATTETEPALTTSATTASASPPKASSTIVAVMLVWKLVINDASSDKIR